MVEKFQVGGSFKDLMDKGGSTGGGGGGESRFFRKWLRFFGRTGLRNFREIENLLWGGGGEADIFPKV